MEARQGARTQHVQTALCEPKVRTPKAASKAKPTKQPNPTRRVSRRPDAFSMSGAFAVRTQDRATARGRSRWPLAASLGTGSGCADPQSSESRSASDASVCCSRSPTAGERERRDRVHPRPPLTHATHMNPAEGQQVVIVLVRENVLLVGRAARVRRSSLLGHEQVAHDQDVALLREPHPGPETRPERHGGGQRSKSHRNRQKCLARTSRPQRMPHVSMLRSVLP